MMRDNQVLSVFLHVCAIEKKSGSLRAEERRKAKCSGTSAALIRAPVFLSTVNFLTARLGARWGAKRCARGEAASAGAAGRCSRHRPKLRIDAILCLWTCRSAQTRRRSPLLTRRASSEEKNAAARSELAQTSPGAARVDELSVSFVPTVSRAATAFGWRICAGAARPRARRARHWDWSGSDAGSLDGAHACECLVVFFVALLNETLSATRGPESIADEICHGRCRVADRWEKCNRSIVNRHTNVHCTQAELQFHLDEAMRTSVKNDRTLGGRS